jgi:hypothetical protein
MLDELRFALEGNFEEDVNNFSPLITFYDTTLMEECFTFIENEGKIEASDEVERKEDNGAGYDDDIMATAIAMQMYKIQRKHINPISNKQREFKITLNA